MTLLSQFIKVLQFNIIIQILKIFEYRLIYEF
jgi:hypothetical protein